MATPRMDITSFVGKLLEQDDVDALREGVRVLAQAVMETEVSPRIGAGPYELAGRRRAASARTLPRHRPGQARRWMACVVIDHQCVKGSPAGRGEGSKTSPWSRRAPSLL